MKKFFNRAVSILLVFALLGGSVPGATLAATTHAPTGAIWGDADNDGDVDLQDVLAIEKHLAGEATAINLGNADVNTDGLIDADDVWLIKEYLVGNISSLPLTDLCLITFDTDGGSAVEPIKATREYPIKKEIPSPAKSGCFFVGWEKADGTPFYKEEPILTDMTLKAVYAELETTEALSIDSFALTGLAPGATFDVEGDFASAADVAQNLSLMTKDGSAPVEATVVQSGGIFKVGAAGGFREGGSYMLILGEGLNFSDKEPMIRSANFTIQKAEADKLRFDDNLIFIQDTVAMQYTLADGSVLEVLDFALVSDDGSSESITGTFDMNGSTLNFGDYVCIYELLHPNDRDYTTSDYADDSIAYIKITDVEGTTHSFESLGGDDLDRILFLPQVVPFSVDTLPNGQIGTTGTVEMSAYDSGLWGMMGFADSPKFRNNDFLVFYATAYEELKSDTLAVYAQITGVSDDDVTYKVIDRNDIDGFMGVYTKKEVKKEDILVGLGDIDAFLDNVAKQAEASGFASYATEYMFTSALLTETLRSSLLDSGLTEAEIMQLPSTLPVNTPQIMPTAAGTAGGRTKVSIDENYPKMTAHIISNGSRYENGVGIELTVQVVLSVDKQISATETSQLKIELTASFIQEIAVDRDIQADETWAWWVIIPYIQELYVGVSIDIRNYTYVSVGAKIYTKTKEVAAWEQLKSTTDDRAVQERLRKINTLQAQAAQLKKEHGDEANALLAQAQTLYNQINSLKGINIQLLEQTLGMENVSTELSDVLNADNADTFRVGLDQLMDKYAEMLKNETDWVKLYEQEIINQNFDLYKIICGNLAVNFVVRANVNIALGAEVEYEVGKRYNFWFNFNIDTRSGTSGSSEMDLLDERFGFQFYVMGTLGLRAGINAEIAIGIVSTKAASIGVSLEFGPYLRLWGYFIYVYTKSRPAGQSHWFSSQEMMGALYLEFGIYVLITAKAQVFNNLIKYEPTLLDKEFPLLTAGVRKNVYDFAYSASPDDILYVRDMNADSSDGITMHIPESYRMMKYIDLREGTKLQEVYPVDKFHYSSTNPNIAVNEYGLITATPSQGVRYLEGELTITWKMDKLSFSVYDISVTIPVIWTNMSNTELNEKFTISVAASGPNGYDVVWSGRYGRLDTFDLPTAEEVLKVLKYDGYDYNGTNLKYSSPGSYQTARTTELSATTDFVYYYDIPLREYTLNVTGIQGSAGTETREYTATYGDTFKLSDLAGTGTNDPQAGEYASFLNLTYEDGSIFAPNTPVNLSFCQNADGQTVSVSANYADLSRTATFTFVGIEAEDLKVRFKAGTIPSTAGLTEHVEEHGGEAAYITHIFPAITATEDSQTYFVHCTMSEYTQRYVLSVITNGGQPTILPRSYTPDAMILEPAVERTGYELIGWCERFYHEPAGEGELDFEDVPFTFTEQTVMPERDMTLVAYWKPRKYTVTFDNGTGQTTREVEYDSHYGNEAGQDGPGLLPKPERPGNVFQGWFTQPNGLGDQIYAQTVFKEAMDQTLYAHWTIIKTIGDGCLEFSVPQSFDYDPKGEGYEFEFELTKDAPEGIEKKDFQVWYRWQGAPLNVDWSKEKPTQGGTYNIKITCIDEAYQFDELIWDETKEDPALVIKRIPMGLNSQTAAFTSGGTVVLQRPGGIKGNGTIIYRFHGYENFTGVFSGIPAGEYNYRVEVVEDRNYEGASTEMQRITVSGYAAGGYNVSFEISTSDSTDSQVFGMYVPAGKGEPDRPLKLLNHGGNDFQKGSIYKYLIASGVMPWEIGGYRLYKDSKHGWLGQTWATDVVYITVDEQYNNPDCLIRHKVLEDRADRIYPDETTFTWLIPESVPQQYAFKRGITSVYNFYSGGANSINLKEEEPEPYTYRWSMEIKDQYYYAYNPFLYYGAPTFEAYAWNDRVAARINEYNQFIKFTSLTGFEIDTVRLREYMIEQGKTGEENNFSYRVMLRFDAATTTNDTRIHEKIIPVTAPEPVAEPDGQGLVVEPITIELPIEAEPETETQPESEPQEAPEPETDTPADPTEPNEGQAQPDPSDGQADTGGFEPVGAAPLLFSNPAAYPGFALPASTGSASPAGAMPVSTTAGGIPTVSAGSVSASRGDTVQIPIRIDGNPSIWGIWMSVSYDSSALELLGYSFGDVFSGSMIVTQKDLSKAPYTFLATCPGLDTTATNGEILTLTFKVNTAQAASVAVNVRQVLDADSNVHPVTSVNGTVRVGGGGIVKDPQGDPETKGDAKQPKEEAGWTNYFKDVSETDWFYGDIEYVVTNGLFIGTSATTFSPYASMSRAMLVTVLYRMEGEPSIVGLTNPFSDVPDGQYYTDAVIWAAENGIVEGYGDGRFGTNNHITRQDLCVMLLRHAAWAETELPTTFPAQDFADGGEVADYAKNAVMALYRAGVIEGKGNGIFDPKGTATRAEVSAMLHRFILAAQ